MSSSIWLSSFLVLALTHPLKPSLIMTASDSLQGNNKLQGITVMCNDPNHLIDYTHTRNVTSSGQRALQPGKDVPNCIFTSNLYKAGNWLPLSRQRPRWQQSDPNREDRNLGTSLGILHLLREGKDRSSSSSSQANNTCQ